MAGAPGRNAAREDPGRILVPAARIPGWLEGFAHRHGVGLASVRETSDGWDVRAGPALAHIVDPRWPGGQLRVSNPAELAERAAGLDYAVLVVRRAGYLVALVASGRGVVGKASGRHIHGRTAAGGWSQKRYERRRGNQADEIAAAAADSLVEVVGRHPAAFLATGGDRPLIAATLAHIGSQGPIGQLPRGPHFAIGTPSRADLAGLPDRVTAVTITVSGDPTD
jgi:hypothetical protein